MTRARTQLEYNVFYPEVIRVAIPSGSALSDAVDLDGLTLAGIVFPSPFDGTSVTVQASLNGSTWFDLYDEAGNAVSIAATPGAYVVVDSSRFAGIRWLRLRSGTASLPVNQTANCTLQLVARAVK